MSLAELIRNALRERNKTATYAQIEAATGVSATYVHNIVSGKRDPNGITLHVLLRLFPHARIELEPGVASAPACFSDELERVRMESERDRLAHERRELELERRIFELEKQLAERAAISPRDELPEHPFRTKPEPSILSPSNK